MESGNDDIWFQIGYALERFRGVSRKLPALETLQRSRGASDDRGSGGRDGDNPGHRRGDPVTEMVSAGVRSLGARMLGLWPERGRPGVFGLLAAAGSGAAAGLLTELARPLLRPDSGQPPDEEPEVGASVLTGVARGLTYGAVVRPRVPGPAFLVGFLYGTAEYVASPWGGLPRLLRGASPHGKLPLVRDLLEPDEEPTPVYLEHLAFGLALAVLYDVVHGENRGMRDEA